MKTVSLSAGSVLLTATVSNEGFALPFFKVVPFSSTLQNPITIQKCGLGGQIKRHRSNKGLNE